MLKKQLLHENIPIENVSLGDFSWNFISRISSIVLFKQKKSNTLFQYFILNTPFLK